MTAMFGDCDEQKDQSTGHKAIWHQGEAETRLRKSSGSPESHDHGEAHPTVMLPAAKKKRDERRFLTKSGDQSWLAGCARN